MNDLIRTAVSPRWVSGATVFVVAWIIGSTAADGMSALQWIGAFAALTAAIAWAVIEQTWPATARAEAAE